MCVLGEEINICVSACGLALWLAAVYSLLCARDLRAEIASFVFNLCPAAKFCFCCAHSTHCVRLGGCMRVGPKSFKQIALQILAREGANYILLKYTFAEALFILDWAYAYL